MKISFIFWLIFTTFVGSAFAEVGVLSGSDELPDDDGYEKDDVELMWELGRQVDARAGEQATAGDAPSICTFAKATAHEETNILTFSPLVNQSRDAEIVAISSQEPYSQLAAAR